MTCCPWLAACWVALQSAPFVPGRSQARRRREPDARRGGASHILAVLEHTGGHRKQAAKALGIGENTLWRKLKSYGLVKPRRRGMGDD